MFNTYIYIDSVMSTPELNFQHSKQSSHGREERLKFVIEQVRNNPNFHFDKKAHTSERCTDLADIEDQINHLLRMMHYAPQTRKDFTEQVLYEMKIL